MTASAGANFLLIPASKVLAHCSPGLLLGARNAPDDCPRMIQKNLPPPQVGPVPSAHDRRRF
jgi:hypothetical protein